MTTTTPTPGTTQGRWGNTSWADTLAFLDRAQQVGMRVLFDFSENVMRCPSAQKHSGKPCTTPPPLDAIRDAVTRLRHHPAILSWYLIDEPDGKKYPPEWVAAAAAAIRALDTTRPISACFDTTARPGGTWRDYANATDVILVDIYPVAGRLGLQPCTAANGCNVTKDVGDSIRATIAATGKTVWYIPQAFGSQEGFPREPSPGETRLMTYTALIAGATGTFAFTREDADAAPPVVYNYVHVGTAQPRSSSLWSEVRRLALEVNEMAPWLMSGRPRPAATSSVAGVDVGAAAGADGSVMLIVANTLGVPVPSVALSVEVGGETGAAAAAADGSTARVLFDPFYREVPLESSGGRVGLTDALEAMSTKVYWIVPGGLAPLPAVTTDPLATNLVFNGDLEFATTVGQPDGWSAAWGTDPAATNAHDTCVTPPGLRHSLRLTTPTDGAGLRAWSYPIKADMVVGEEYTLSLLARGGEEGQTLAVGLEALFGQDNVTCPGVGSPNGQCSYTPQLLRLEQGTWTRLELAGKCRFQPDETGSFGAAGMVSVELLSAGMAWIADVRLHLKNVTGLAAA